MSIRILGLVTLAGMLCAPILSRAELLQTRTLLRQSRYLSDETLAYLFNVGDHRINDLVKSLDDKDEVVRKNAQIVIRYLGNEVGMKRLLGQYERSATNTLAGPVPLPLQTWDYQYIRDNYVNGSNRWDSRATSYIYALALDGSPSATTLLNELNGATDRHFALDRVTRTDGNVAKPMKGALPDVIIQNAFFLEPVDRDEAHGSVLSYNQAKTKCLVIVWAGSIPPAETYHVVVRKLGEGWAFFSVTQVAVS